MPQNKDNFFSASHLREGLKARAVKSAGVTISAQAVKLLFQMLSIIILARLLPPSDFGLVAMVTVFSGLALQLTEGGLSMATIQKEHITHGQVSNLFWMNAGLGVAFCLVGVAVSPLIAAVYDEPRLTFIMIVTSLSFVIGGLSVQHDALLRRQMQFKTISVIDITSMGLGIIAGIILALYGGDYWSLVAIPLVTLFMKTIMRWGATRWRPSLFSRGTGVAPLLGFGANLTGANFIGYAALNLTPFVVGYIGGSQTLGLFNRANTLTSIPSKQLLPPVMSVLQPTLSRVSTDKLLLQSTILSLLRKLVLVTMFVTVAMALLAEDLVLILLGPDWLEAVPMFRVLAIFSLVEPIAGLLAVSLVAAGYSRALLKWKVMTFLILVISIGIGAFWGALGVIAAYAISGLAIRLPGFLVFVTYYLPVSFKQLVVAIIPSTVCAIGTIVIVYPLSQYLAVENPLLSVLFYFFLVAGAYLALAIVIRASRAQLKEIAQLSKMLILRKAGHSER